MAHLASIANALGVSVSTVSRALRRHPSISAATMKRVEEEAARQGHRPNPYVNLVMAHMRRAGPLPHAATLAWIDSFPKVDDWRSSPTQRQFFAGAAARAEARGFGLERLRVRGGGIKRERVMGILDARGILGALCPEATAISESLINPARLATVTVGFRSESPALHFSTNDQYATARAAHRELRRRGYRRVGLVTRRYLESVIDYRFVAGYLSVAAEAAESTPPVIMIDEITGSEFQAWLAEHRPDALLSTQAPELPLWLAKSDPHLVASLGRATLDWQADQAEIAGLRQDHERVGAAAVDLLIAQLEGNEIGPPDNARGTLVESVWHDGPSLRPAQPLAKT